MIKRIILIVVIIGIHQIVNAQMMVNARMGQKKFDKPLNVAVFVYNGVGLGDMNGPIDVFTKAGNMTGGQYHVYTVALKPGTVTTQAGGLKFMPDYTADQMPQPDILVIPGGSVGLADSMRYNQPVLNFIKQYGEKAQVLMSICTAAYFVGQTGAFDGHKVTTHFFQAEDLQKQFPKSTVIQDVRFVDDGKLVTASGVTTGIDASLHLVARFSGDRMEKLVEGAIQYNMKEHDEWPEAVGGMRFDRGMREQLKMLMPHQ
ncbi:DJ-1/PfpI family protein [Mucilaginibacter paludis]|uniref:ThiJ/PfpI domain-containing protein n=1 Tax=Mucilaginibacter paludis DSM 18603 TaxID=714943 RepID=H1Y850_9SPHI|nr:DJ-1/PfpI family protein [Mucilaginibacter paludis]EHQ31072.1 ThiJ/PfpI domain-containing protein [Mucilaginibacter paludis DSM 18603]